MLIGIEDKLVTRTKEVDTFTYALAIKKKDGTTWLSLKTSLVPNYLLLMKLINDQLATIGKA
ncbi:hypothetical protein KSX_50420 [Ktedonospora formicarum]|uniref:Uncharacterized protein n=1 Tax=Ktedonospora formicarum TaxID=2778364 RepID=A0A8J3I7L1_9CHLR|nr:hypothetical protein KSX_50420 [Ktedonospora formicarum]